MLEEVREALPGSLAQAQELIGDREQHGRAGPPGGRADHRDRPRRARLADLRHRGRPPLPGRGGPHPRRGPPGGRGDPRRGRRLRRLQARQLRGRPHQDHRLGGPRPREAARPRPRPRRAGLRGRATPPSAATTRRPCASSADAYVDAKLGAFEAVLSKTLEAVGRGRQKLHGRIATDDLGAHLAAQDDDGDRPSSSPATPTTWPASPTSPSRHRAAVPRGPGRSSPYGQQQRRSTRRRRTSRTRTARYQQQYAQRQQAADPYGYQQADPYAAGYAAAAGVRPAPRAPGPAGAPAAAVAAAARRSRRPRALDETSLFDTSMITWSSCAAYEQGR